jgi:hypothetical protein
MFRNKKGNYVDIVFFIAISFVIIFTAILIYILISNFNSALPNIDIVNNTPIALQTSQSLVDKYPAGFDWIMPILYVLFLGFTVWSASQVQSTNKFFFIGIFVTILLTLFAMMMENFWDMFKTNSNISPYVSKFVYSVFMMDNLRYFTLFFCFVVMIFLYTRRD